MAINAVQEAKNLQEQIVAWRRELHQIPELDFDLFETSKFIQEKLDDMKIPYTLMAKTGVVGLIEGGSQGKTIALRADMDALSVEEDTGLSYASTNENMHACGHDAHMAILLATAQVLAEHRDQLKGNVKLIFQPAEEKLGGALPMIEEGCLENPEVDAVVALHAGQIFPQVKAGQIGISYGPVMASVDRFEMKVIGKGGHGAMPHNTVDPILIAAEIITSLQKIISREIAPTDSGVVTVAEIKGGSTHNVIPSEVKLQGTARSANAENREFILDRIETISKSTASTNRGEVEIEMIRGFPVTVNDKEFTQKFKDTALKIVNPEDIVEIDEPTMGAEDMAYYLEKAPGTLFFLGTNNEEKGIVYPNHHPKFNLDEDVLWKGAALFLQTVNDYFSSY